MGKITLRHELRSHRKRLCGNKILQEFEIMPLIQIILFKKAASHCQTRRPSLVLERYRRSSDFTSCSTNGKEKHTVRFLDNLRAMKKTSFTNYNENAVAHPNLLARFDEYREFFLQHDVKFKLFL